MIESYFAEPLPPVAHLVADSKDWVRVASGAQKTWHCNSWHMTPVFAATIVPLGVHWQKQAARNNAVRNARNRSITAIIHSQCTIYHADAAIAILDALAVM